MNEVVTKEAKVMSNELAMILMNRTPEAVVSNTRKILFDKNLDSTKKIEVAREYLNLLADEIMPEPEVVKADVEIKQPPKHNRIPFETKTSMIEYYINNNVSYGEVAEKFGVNKNTAGGILSKHRKQHPELYVNK